MIMGKLQRGVLRIMLIFEILLQFALEINDLDFGLDGCSIMWLMSFHDNISGSDF